MACVDAGAKRRGGKMEEYLKRTETKQEGERDFLRTRMSCIYS